MTNINCSSNCIYQENGVCNLENNIIKKITSTKDCAYFVDSQVTKKEKN